MKRKFCALVMCGALFVAMMPSTVLADVEDDSTQTEEATESAEEESVSTDQPDLEDDSSYVVEIGSEDVESIVIEDGAEDAAYSDAEEDASGEVSVLEETADVEADAEEEEADEEDKVFTATSNGIKVEVTAPAGALPEDAVLSVERYASDSDQYKEAAEAIDYEIKDDNNSMAALDISFLSDGVEVEPTETVKVSIDVSQILPSDVDASTIEVQHLVENDYSDDVTPVVVANDSDYTEGTIDEEKAKAEFEVNSFSVFTVEWNDGTTDTIEVHVYNINGTSINETLDEPSTEIANNGTIEISELANHLLNNSSLATEYTYQYATVIYETDLGGPGYSSDTVGGSDNPVTSISKSGTTYTVTLTSGTETVSDPALIKINLYYSTPTITLSTEDPYTDKEVSFTTTSEYFQHEEEGTTTYAWALSNDSAGTLTHETAGEATFVWDTETAQAGDQVTITVTKTVTYTDSEGNTLTEAASDTYTLTYGEDPVTFTVTLGGTPQANAHVAIVDENGNTISTGITDENGQVTLYTVDGGTYTVGVTYCVADTSGIGGGSTSRYTAEGSVTLSDDGTVVTGDTTLTLGTAVVSGPGNDTSGITGGGIDGVYYYEHIDVKVTAAGTENTQVSFSDLDAVYVYDKYGNLIYVSEDLERNPETGDYNCLFDINDDEDQHSIVVSSEDTIVIVYEVVDSDGNYSTYTASYNSGGTYPTGEYYPYTAVNAYQLYNYINSTSYTEAQFEEMVESGELTGNGIDIGGMGYTEVADCLCDTRTTTGQAGLDFVIYVTEIEDVFGQYDFRVAKTLEGAPSTLTVDNIEDFTFELQDVSSVADGDTYTEGIWTTTGDPTIGSTSADSWTQGDDGNWNAVVDFANALTYTAEDGTYFYYFVLSEEDPKTATPTQQYYGLKFTVTYSSSTGVAEIIASYCDLTKGEEDGTYNRASAWSNLTAQTDHDEESDEDYTYFSIPFINTYNTTGFELKKVDENGDPLNGAEFTIATSDGTTLYFTSSTDDEGNTIYTLATSETGSAEIAVTGVGPVSIQGIAAGTYTLTETTAPTGYESIDAFTIEVDEDGSVTLTSENTSVSAEDDLVTVTNTPETTEISVEKVWVDNNNKYMTRPNEISVQLLAGEEAYGEAVTLDEENSWTYKWEELPKYDSTGTEIEYTVQEISSINGYETSYSDDTFTITNTLTGTTEAEVEKVWVDNDDEYKNRPDEISVQLLAGEEAYGEAVTLDEENSWTYKWEELPKYDSTGTEIEYTVQEISSIDGYETSYSDDTFIITNTLQTTKISVIKVWNDDENRDGTRTEEVQVQLKAGEENVGEAVTLDGSNNWSYTWEDLPVYVNGEKVAYTVEEVSIPDEYTASYTSETDDDGNVTFTMVNTHEDALTQITVNKEWEDADDKNGIRPDSVTVQLMANDEACKGDIENPVTLDENNNWSYTWEDLYSFEDGKLIEYTVEETAVERYVTEIGDLTPAYDDDNNLTGYTITVTNTLEMVDIEGSKVWENDSESDRPDSITIYLYADGEEMTDADGNVITATATSDDGWAWSFTDLPKYQPDGETEIEYTVLEEEVSGYIPTYDYEDGSVTITNAIPVVEKDVSDPAYGESTDDNLHQDETDNNDTLEYKMEADHIGGAHDLVLHDFLSDQLDITTLEIQSVTLYAGEGDEGTALEEGTDYTVSYGECTADCGLEGCSFEIHVFDEDVENLSADAYVIVIFDIEVKEGVEDFDENYVDEIDNFVGLSFTAFSVRQYAEPDETETYSYGFDLYKYDADTEESLAGVEFILSKAGDDGTVYAQFEATDSTYLLTGWVDSKDEATTIVTGSDGNAVVEGLHDGTFSIEETKALEGYKQKVGTMTVTITVDEDDPLHPTITATNADVDGMEVQISNTPGSDETIEIIGSKTWDDSDDLDGIRPDSITIHLMADGEEVDSLTVTADDDWAWSFDDLAKYQDDGTTEIVYTITEDAVDDYDTTVDGYNVTNSHTPEEEPEPEPEPTPGPGPSEPNPTGTDNPNPTGTNNPEPTNPSKTADADLPVLPIAGCCVAFALIAAALVLRRREADE